jgi:hypothetical protein
MRSDPMLTVDDLGDLFPADPDPAESALAVSALHELFPAAPPPAPAVQPSHAAAWPAPALELDRLDDFFPDWRAAAPVFAEGDDTLSMDDDDVIADSEIQRAALEFQRFAERFHAFASGCRPGVIQADR